MSVTPNFSWPLIENTDFVTNLPADLEALADDIDADVWAIKGTADAALPETIIDAAGDLIYGSAADTAARLPIGTAGQLLAVNSGATAPEWINPAGGASAFTLINSGGTALSTGTTTVSGISGKNSLFIYVIGGSGSTDQTITMRFNSDTGQNYRFVSWDQGGTNAPSWNWGFTATSVPIVVSGVGTDTWNFMLRVDGCIGAGAVNGNRISTVNNQSGGRTATTGNFFYESSAAITSVSLICNSGTFDAGTMYVYGA